MTNDKLCARGASAFGGKIKNYGIYYLYNIAKRYVHLTFVIGYLTLILGSSAMAEIGQAGQDIAVLKAGVGARPLGMGSAFAAVADNADAAFWNPAGLGFIDKNEITTTQTKLSTDADHYYLSYVRPFLGGGLGISWIQIGLGSMTQTSSEVDTAHNEVVNINAFSYFSNAYMLSYGRKVNDKLSFGLSAKYLNSDMFQMTGGQAYGYTVTPGVLVKLTPLTIGIKVDDLLNQQKWGTGTVENAPPKLRLGIAYAKANPGLFALDITQILRSGYGVELGVGYEWQREGLSFRGGYAEGGLTAGAGFMSGHTRVDYAYVVQRALSRDNVHRISLSGIW